MSTRPDKDRKVRERDGAYRCRDGVSVHCGHETIKMHYKMDEVLVRLGLKNQREVYTAPRNGILLRRGRKHTTLVSGMQTDKSMRVIEYGGPGRTRTLPSTVLRVDAWVFEKE